MTQSLETAIYRYRADWYTFLARGSEASERGDSDKNIKFDRASTIVLEKWKGAAESLPAAILALEVAAEDYDAGDTPRIPAMINAALGWLRAEQHYRDMPHPTEEKEA